MEHPFRMASMAGTTHTQALLILRIEGYVTYEGDLILDCGKKIIEKLNQRKT